MGVYKFCKLEVLFMVIFMGSNLTPCGGFGNLEI